MTDVQLHLGDSLDVLRTLPEASVDALVTDPPYGIVNQFGTMGTAKSGTRRLQFDFDKTQRVADVLGLALTKLKPSSALFVFTSIDLVGDLLPLARAAGFTVKPWAWVKKYPPPAGYGNWWPSAFELAFYGYRNSPYFGDTDTKRSNVFVGDSYRHGQPGKVKHPTQKPLRLMRHIVDSICPPDGVVLDPFAGSGSTLVAAIQTGRRAIGIEISEEYHAIAQRRIEAEQGALFAEAAK